MADRLKSLGPFVRWCDASVEKFDLFLGYAGQSGVRHDDDRQAVAIQFLEQLE